MSLPDLFVRPADLFFQHPWAFGLGALALGGLVARMGVRRVARGILAVAYWVVFVIVCLPAFLLGALGVGLGFFPEDDGQPARSSGPLKLNVWEQVVTRVGEKGKKDGCFDIFFKKTKFLSEEGGIIRVRVPDQSAAKWIVMYHAQALKEALTELGRADAKVLLVSGDDFQLLVGAALTVAPEVPGADVGRKVEGRPDALPFPGGTAMTFVYTLQMPDGERTSYEVTVDGWDVYGQAMQEALKMRDRLPGAFFPFGGSPQPVPPPRHVDCRYEHCDD